MRSLIITGVSGTLGGAFTRYFIDQGWKVIGSVRNEKAGHIVENTFSAEIRSGQLQLLTLDGKSPELAALNLQTLLDSVWGVSALINNAATDSWDNITELTPECISEVLAVNLAFPCLLSATLIRHWRKHSIAGTFLHISSLLAQAGAHNSSLYAASKAGLEAFSRCIAVEHGRERIRSNVLRISACEHALLARHQTHRSTPIQNNSVVSSEVPLGRKGRLSDYCEAAYFLTSDKSMFVTGQVLSIDGGISALYPKYNPPSPTLENNHAI